MWILVHKIRSFMTVALLPVSLVAVVFPSEIMPPRHYFSRAAVHQPGILWQETKEEIWSTGRCLVTIALANWPSDCANGIVRGEVAVKNSYSVTGQTTRNLYGILSDAGERFFRNAPRWRPRLPTKEPRRGDCDGVKQKWLFGKTAPLYVSIDPHKRHTAHNAILWHT